MPVVKWRGCFSCVFLCFILKLLLLVLQSSVKIPVNSSFSFYAVLSFWSKIQWRTVWQVISMDGHHTLFRIFLPLQEVGFYPLIQFITPGSFFPEDAFSSKSFLTSLQRTYWDHPTHFPRHAGRFQSTHASSFRVLPISFNAFSYSHGAKAGDIGVTKNPMEFYPFHLLWWVP